MNRTLVLAAGGLILAGGMVIFYVARGRPGKQPEHARGEARRGHEVLPTVKAMIEAPAGATPCESAFLAFTAGHERAREIGRTSPFVRIAPREQFIAGCSKLTPAQQQCLVPIYDLRHEDECMKIRPPKEALTPIVEVVDVKQDEQEPKLQAPPGGQPVSGSPPG